jgi:hypothetical protein
MKQDKKSFIHIKEVIDTIFATSGVPINFDDIRIWKVWEGVVGKKIAKHTRPSSIKKGVLLVKVSDSIWLQDLEFKAETIKEGLNKKLQREAVKKIRFKVGIPQDREQSYQRNSTQEDDQDLTPERQREIEEILARIKDKEIRESLRRIMIARTKKGDVC